jgi:1-acyl-sn-glycerol-3-phosphate acyltransferase
MKRLVFRLWGRSIIWLTGWKVVGIKEPLPIKSVVVAAPHTSNFDFLLARSAFEILDMPVRFTIKKEWMGFPLGWLLKALGAIAIDKSVRQGEKKGSSVESMAALFSEYEKLAILVTPEGTRSLRTEWRTGFYHVAKSAGVPLVLGYLDYKKKEAGIGKIFLPGDNFESDMKEIMAFYEGISARFPAKFSTDIRYSAKTLPGEDSGMLTDQT